MKLKAQGRRRAEDDLVPLINVVFLLLIFFLLVGTLMPPPPVAVRYVEGGEQPLPSLAPGALVVTADGGAHLDGEYVAAGQIAARLAARATSGSIAVVADRALTMRDLRPVLDALAAAGLSKVELVTVRGDPK